MRYSGLHLEKTLEMLRKKRCELAYSQEFVARKLGISQADYSKMESGAQIIDTNQLYELLFILQYDAKEFFKEEVNRQSGSGWKRGCAATN